MPRLSVDLLSGETTQQHGWQMLTSRLIERMQAYAAAQGGDLTVFVKG